MTDAPELLLAHHLKALRLPTFLREQEKQARLRAAEGVNHVRYLARLTELELIDRERRMVERRIEGSKFPAEKSLDNFNFTAILSLNKMMELELVRCDWIERTGNGIALEHNGGLVAELGGVALNQGGPAILFFKAARLHAFLQLQQSWYLG